MSTAPRRLVALLLLALAACAPAALPPPPAAPAGRTTPSPQPESWPEASVRDAQGHTLRGDFDAAERLLGAAIERAGREHDERALAVLQAELAETQSQAYFYRNRGDAEALRVAAEAQQIALRVGDRAAEAKAIHAEGMVRYGRLLWQGSKDFSEPRAVFERALAMRQALGDQSGVARSTFHVGLTYEQEGKGERARPLYEQALALGERVNDKMAMAYALRHLAGLHEERGDLDQALALHRRCLALREEIGAVRLVPYALIAVADLEVKKGDHVRARASYERALALAEQTESGPALLWSHQGLGALDEREGRLDLALSHYQRALAKAEEISHREGIAAAAEAAAKVHEALGDTKRSRELAEQARRARAGAGGG